MSRAASVAIAVLSLVGCSASKGDDPQDSATTAAGYPLDDVLRFDDLQAVGTHNSYHVATSDSEPWDYTHAPLDVQLGEQGVRQFELDFAWDPELATYNVLHLDIIDEGTTCPTLTACAATLWGWSQAHPGHHPILVLLEPKDSWDPVEVDPNDSSEGLDALDAELLAGFPEDHLVTPAMVQGDHPDLRTALEVDGWPTLGELRGRALFVLHDSGGRRDAYVADLDRRPMFPDAQGDATLPYAAVHTMNDPFDADIGPVVDFGHLVRTRADSDTEEARTNDTAKRDQALASGAHFVSTDFPVQAEWSEYVVEMPGGTPSRCNPRTAPAECTSLAIEDPELLEQ